MAKVPDVNQVDFDDLAAEVREVFASHIALYEEKYRVRAALRKQWRFPTIAFLGAGQVGKDTAAEVVAARTGLTYIMGGTAQALTPFVAYLLGAGQKEVFAERHSHREYWFQLAAAYTRKDPAALVRLQLADSDITGGLRRCCEIKGAVMQGVVTVPVWVNRYGYTEGAHEVSQSLVEGLGGKVLRNDREGLHHFEDTVVALALELGFSINCSPLHVRQESG